MQTIDAITSRWSCRAYLDKPVSREQVQSLLDIARWAPSGVNTQPWQVAVVSGATKQRISDAIIQARESGQKENPDYGYYPPEWNEPYKGRRKATGLALYGALKIERGDAEAQKNAWFNNYRFFGAPVGLFIFIDRQLETGSWVDLGMFIQSLMLAAIDAGLATCPQAALAEYPDIVREALSISAEQKLVAGLSLGYADMAHPVNQYRTEREPVETFSKWYDLD
ncbi:MAG: nitroreductase [Gammaproteobacteria bacterium]|nr:nitroreductase [Gammaproteobacteria bacterium]